MRAVRPRAGCFCALFIGFLCHLSAADFVPLGEHMHQGGDVDTISVDAIPSPREFFETFTLPGQPVLMKGFAQLIPSYELWNDAYLAEHYGELAVGKHIRSCLQISAGTCGYNDSMPWLGVHGATLM